jgi:hypothetical protein
MLNPHHFRGDAVTFYTKMYNKRKGGKSDGCAGEKILRKKPGIS